VLFPVPDDAQPAHVLVVDDDAPTAARVAETVRALGHRVTVTLGWTEALRAFGRSDVDLVLMDAVMPGVDGFRLTRLLRARSASYVPIVFLTGLADTRAREQGIAAGADDFLAKPVDPLELKVRLTAMLRIRSLTRDLEARSRVLARLASIDALTGIGNRRSFDEALPRELATPSETGAPLSLLLLDIDHFKQVNDTFGHTVGDALLGFFGRMLGEATRASDACYRYGGEEFAVIARGTGYSQALQLGERIRSAFATRSDHATVAGPQSVSIGICSADQFSYAIESATLIAGADTALYRAKALGRNCVCRFDTRVDARVA
jgi:two-component system, cell cycle response regulator